MPMITVAFGVLLVLLGVGVYLGTGMQSWTALIPAIFGVVLAALGGLALALPAARRHLMHVAVVVGVLGVVAPAMRVAKAMRSPEGFVLNDAGAAQIAMAIIALGFVATCVVSFVRARRAA